MHRSCWLLLLLRFFAFLIDVLISVIRRRHFAISDVRAHIISLFLHLFTPNFLSTRELIYLLPCLLSKYLQSIRLKYISQRNTNEIRTIRYVSTHTLSLSSRSGRPCSEPFIFRLPNGRFASSFFCSHLSMFDLISLSSGICTGLDFYQADGFF